jgi:hypothetical protein
VDSVVQCLLGNSETKLFGRRGHGLLVLLLLAAALVRLVRPSVFLACNGNKIRIGLDQREALHHA